jgi:hypothetical protein
VLSLLPLPTTEELHGSSHLKLFFNAINAIQEVKKSTDDSLTILQETISSYSNVA